MARPSGHDLSWFYSSYYMLSLYICVVMLFSSYTVVILGCRLWLGITVIYLQFVPMTASCSICSCSVPRWPCSHRDDSIWNDEILWKSALSHASDRGGIGNVGQIWTAGSFEHSTTCLYTYSIHIVGIVLMPVMMIMIDRWPQWN